MSNYILTILAASLAACMIELLAPKGDGGRTASYVRMIAGLFLLVSLLTPLREGLNILRAAADGDLAGSIADRLPESMPEDYEATFGSALSAVGKQETEAWVTEILDSVFKIPPSGCAVEAVCESDGTELTLRELRIGLKGKYALEDPHPLEAYFAEQLGCPCYVTVL